MTTKDEIFISVDIETSGPIPGEYSLLSIGACDVYDPENGFSCLLKPTSDKIVPEALAVTGLSLDKLRLEGEAPAKAMASFARWIADCSENGKPVFVGLNAAFDWSFINYYFILYYGSNPFGIAALDIKALFMGTRNYRWEETRSSNMKKITGAITEGTHDALEDAKYQAELFRLILQSRR